MTATTAGPWKSDGTSAGTVLVKDIDAGADGSDPTYLTAATGALFFTADDGSNGKELWKSDGTSAGTVLVKDIDAGAGGSYPTYLTAATGAVFFSAGDDNSGRAVMSDGTSAGTVMVKDIRPTYSSSYPKTLRQSAARCTSQPTTELTEPDCGSPMAPPLGRCSLRRPTKPPSMGSHPI